MTTTIIPVKKAISDKAKINSFEAYEDQYRKSLEDPHGFWLNQAKRLKWSKEPTRTLEGGFDHLDYRWFGDGELNATVSCIDQHLEDRGDKVAIIWAKDEPGDYEKITYHQLYREVCRMANTLKSHGVRRGDRVCIYLPMIPQLAFAVLACARIGAIHSVVFAGFSATSLRDRITDANCRILITADEGLRGGRKIPLKKISDEAVMGTQVDTVLVVQRTGADVFMDSSRDYWMHEETAKERPVCPPEIMNAEDPLFVLYTSGSTGRPKGVLHTTGGYMVWASLTHEWIFDLKEDDVYCCAADVGWITGHTYILYGPFANGATTVLFESTPLYPDAGRYWKMVEDLGINIFYTAPTALRAIARDGDEFVHQHDRSSLRILGTVGEPINPEVWKWYNEVVGNSQCAIVDTWWQTETGGIMITPLPGAIATKPGSATFPFPGVDITLVDPEGEEISGNGVSGNLCIRKPWPGLMRTLLGDHERLHETYFSQYDGFYFTGDGCRRDEDGYYWITGRVDDVLNVSGHRMGTAEVESALVAHDEVAEAAVVGVPHEIKGQGIYAYVICKGNHEDDAELVKTLRNQVRTVIGPIAQPDAIQIVGGLPKTRSGKIMRRILRKVAAGDTEDLGDLSTLADPTVVDSLVTGRVR